MPLDLAENQEISEINLCQSKVCGDRVQCYDCGNLVAIWLNQCLGRSDLRLLRQFTQNSRINKKGENSTLSLANQAQYLLLNTASVKTLAQSIPNFIMNESSFLGLLSRFRANFIVDFDAPFIESECQIVDIGDVQFNVSILFILKQMSVYSNK